MGPLVETHVQEKPLSVALREIDAGLLTVEPYDPSAAVEPVYAEQFAPEVGSDFGQGYDGSFDAVGAAGFTVPATDEAAEGDSPVA